MTKQTEQQTFHVTQERLLAFVRAMIGGSSAREDGDYALPPGPWDSVVRSALEGNRDFGSQPEPWRSRGPEPPLRIGEPVGPRPQSWRGFVRRHPEAVDALGSGRFGDAVALNPQPLPPRFALLVAVANAVISRAELLQEIAGVTSREGEQQGVSIVGGYTSRFSRDWCGTGFKLRYPCPGPHPHWFPYELDGVDLLVVAMQFERAATEAFSPDLRHHLTAVSASFVEAALSRLP